MSNQAERIKAFKLAQHARLQKQDEEEQWISSEELCTEGSSDEESGNAGKRSQRKQKRNAHTEKRGISPLAQPPRDAESTSYQRDSKYLLPDAAAASGDEKQSPAKSQADAKKSNDLTSVDAKVEKLVLHRNKASTSKAASSSLESETDDEKEIEKMIQWRPKRGSLKLPEFPEGMTVEVPASESVN